MTGLEIVVVVAMGGAVFAAAKHSEKTKTGRVGPGRGIPAGSKLVKIYNSTGAKPVASSDAGGAAAELAGRAIGATARTGNRRWRAVRTATSRGRDRLADRAAPRWEQRAQTRPAESVIDRWKNRRAARAKARQADQDAPPSKPAAAPSPTKLSPPAPGPAPPAPPAPRLTVVPNPPTGGTTMTADTEVAAATAGISPPSDWAVMIDRVSNFQPEDDTALVEFMKGEAAAVVAYADALVQTRENCTNDVGLDPSAVAGFTTYSEHMSEASDRMAEALQQFMTVYGEVLGLRAGGVELPFNGRWFTGEAS